MPDIVNITTPLPLTLTVAVITLMSPSLRRQSADDALHFLLPIHFDADTTFSPRAIF